MFTPETQEQLKKINTVRLGVKPGRAGYSLNRLDGLAKAELLKVLAETMLAKPASEFETEKH